MENEIEKNLENKIKKRKTLLPIIIIFIAVLIMAIVMCYFSFFSEASIRERKINNLIASAEKYLDDLDYEKAIAEYEAVLKLDPQNNDIYEAWVNAYIDWAEYEFAGGNVEGAIALLQEAQLKLEDMRTDDNSDIVDEQLSKIEDKLNEVQQMYLSDDNGGSISDAITLDNQPLRTVGFEEIDGFYTNVYTEYQLSDDDSNYFSSIIQLCESGSLEEAANYLQLKGLSREDLNDRGNILFEGYRICYSYLNLGDMANERISIIPEDDGNGFLLFKEEIFESNYLRLCYTKCPCVNHIFNGEFNQTRIDGESVYYYSGTVWNSFFDGEIVCSIFNSDGTSQGTQSATFDRGYSINIIGPDEYGYYYVTDTDKDHALIWYNESDYIDRPAHQLNPSGYSSTYYNEDTEYPALFY